MAKKQPAIKPTHAYTVDQAAKLAGISPSLVRNMCRDGRVQAKKRGEGKTNGWTLLGEAVQRLREAYAPIGS